MKPLAVEFMKYSWFVAWGPTEYLDDRGRVKNEKIFMTEKQAKYFEKKHPTKAQANHEHRW